MAGAHKLKFAQLLAEHRRLGVLQLLREAPGNIAPDDVLATALETRGHRPSQDALRNDLLYLQELLLVQLTMGSPWTVELLQRGADVAAGRAQAQGVAVPEIP